MLSHQSVTGLVKQIPNSCIKDFNQSNSSVTLVTTLYSASIEDRATVVCFLADQEIRLVPGRLHNHLLISYHLYF